MFGGYDSHEIQEDDVEDVVVKVLIWIIIGLAFLFPLAVARYSRDGMLFAFLASITLSAIIFDFSRTEFGISFMGTAISVVRRVLLAFFYVILGIGTLSVLVAAFRWVFIS
jgi:hypothetical protein